MERLFGTITTDLLPTLAGHIPPGNHGKPVTPPALALSQLDAVIGRYLVDDYHRRVHPETGEPPVKRWLAGGWLPRMPDTSTSHATRVSALQSNSVFTHTDSMMKFVKPEPVMPPSMTPPPMNPKSRLA